MAYRRRRMMRLASPVILVATLAVPTFVAVAVVNTPPAAAWINTPTAYVSNYGDNSVTPIDLSTNTVGAPVTVGTRPTAVAVTPDGQTAYVVNSGSNTVTPINVDTNIHESPIGVGSDPQGIAIAPDGETAYVTDSGSNTLTPINLATNAAEPSIVVGPAPTGIAITPDGRTAYVVTNPTYGYNVTPVNLTTDTTGTPIPIDALGGQGGIAITPDGKSLYIIASSPEVSTINTTTNTVGTPISFSPSFELGVSIAISPDGKAAYAAGPFLGIIPIDVAISTAAPYIATPGGAFGIAVSPDSKTEYVTEEFSGDVRPLDTATGTLGPAIPLIPGSSDPSDIEPFGIAITPDQAPTASWKLSLPPAPNLPVFFDASASSSPVGSIASYTWNFGDGTSQTTTSPLTSHAYVSAGTYSVKLTVTNTQGTSTTQTFTGQMSPTTADPRRR